MKALLINGSPRPHGCTYTALTELKRTLEGEEIEVELIHVGNKDIRENGATAEGEFAFFLIVIIHASYVRGKQVGGKLDTLRVGADRLCERARKARFTGSRDIVKQNMPAGKKSRQHELYLLLLSEYDLLYISAYRGSEFVNFHKAMTSVIRFIDYIIHSNDCQGFFNNPPLHAYS